MSYSSLFKVIGSNKDLLIVDDQNESGYLLKNPILKQIDITRNFYEHANIGGGTIKITEGLLSCETVLVSSGVDILSGEDLKRVGDPFSDKTVMDLMFAVEKKLRGRG